MVEFTLAIPTYNRAKYLPIILERLRSQVDLENLSWEIIIIDNNSTDDTADVIHSYQAKWDLNCSLNYFLEPEQGVTFARLRAVREAKGQLIAFLDDDNLPAPNWVKEAVNFAQEHPQAGAFGGQIHGAFEVKPPENIERIQGLLAIRERGDKANLYDPINLSLPPGAALVFRKQAWDESIPNKLIFKGRLGKLKVAGDDFELLLHLHKAGWEIWYNPNMHTYHQIPHWRLEKDYLITLARGCGLSIYQLRLINASNWQEPIIFIKIFLNNFRRVLKHIIKYRNKLNNDIVARAEMEFYLSSMLSPFYSLILAM
ncbi:hormogonium polysaccharide biosynthesis glycosyltransferase HpsE [Fischerella sp. JS2]|uniref:hormogonium polysaccharide biosynthesis glycosyltransferase HpsE n=1 Tax=Fischerella sp. JS2 TaxID=2597771 RepID=UPI0028F02AAC|nr:hormogonium polysaccharide biosynthesis glycosyltransferase HpsE [Fischerella sp. JS2]